MLEDKSNHWLTQPLASPSPSKNPQILRWMAERIFKFSLPVGGSVEANLIAERLAVTPWILQSGYYLQATAEASAEAAYPLGEPTILCSRRMKVS